MSEPITVEMLPAFHWVCPECGEGQFEAGLVREALPETLTGALDNLADAGITYFNGILLRPEYVDCTFCKRNFPTDDYSLGLTFSPRLADMSDDVDEDEDDTPRERWANNYARTVRAAIEIPLSCLFLCILYPVYLLGIAIIAVVRRTPEHWWGGDDYDGD